MIYKCNETITRKQQDYLARLAELSIEAVLGGKNSLSYRVLFRSCCDDLDDNFEEVLAQPSFPNSGLASSTTQ